MQGMVMGMRCWALSTTRQVRLRHGHGKGGRPVLFPTAEGGLSEAAPQRGSVQAAAGGRSSEASSLSWVAPENREEVLRVQDLAEQSLKKWEIVCTDFYAPSIVADCMSLFSQRSDVLCVPWGGYAQAERQRWVV